MAVNKKFSEERMVEIFPGVTKIKPTDTRISKNPSSRNIKKTTK